MITAPKSCRLGEFDGSSRGEVRRSSFSSNLNLRMVMTALLSYPQPLVRLIFDGKRIRKY